MNLTFSLRATAAVLLTACVAPVIAQMPPAVQGRPEAGPVTITGRVMNGTTNRPAIVEEVALLKPGQGMQELELVKPQGPDFRFKPVDGGAGPLLLRARYGGETFIQVIPPVPEARRRPQTLTVFEGGARAADMAVHSGLQVLKRKDSLRVSRFYAIENKSNPPRMFSGQSFRVIVPQKARNVEVQLQHRGSMPLPNVLDTKGVLTRGIRPGSAELAVNFELDGHVLEVEPHELAGQLAVDGILVVLFQPDDAKPDITGAEAEVVEIPDLGKALKMQLGTKAVLDFGKGGFMYEDPMKSDSNAVFEEPWKAAAGALLALLILFTGASVIAASGIRITRKRNS
jgi:hypothetical protein